MTRRSYGQFCPVAGALDVVGDRWTLLIVRELLLGPQRFTDLLAALPGIGTSLLATRLKQLEQAGAATRERLAPPAGATAYRLTARGEGLGPVVLALARWGRELLGSPAPGEPLRPELLGLYLAASADPTAFLGVRERYEVQVGEDAMHVEIDDGRAWARAGRAPGRTDLVLRMDQATFLELALRDADLATLVDTDRVDVTGDPAALSRAAHLFSTPPLSRED
jgi:DNA-binding HxlR family transcriptional regulator